MSDGEYTRCEKSVDVHHNTEINWWYPLIGTCGDSMDVLRLGIYRTRAIPDLEISFDGDKSEWVITQIDSDNDGNVTTKETRIPELDIDESEGSDVTQ